MVVKNEELKEIQDICRRKATLVMDEFYSGYYYGSNCDGTTISAAVNVKGIPLHSFRRYFVALEAYTLL